MANVFLCGCVDFCPFVWVATWTAPIQRVTSSWATFVVVPEAPVFVDERAAADVQEIERGRKQRKKYVPSSGATALPVFILTCVCAKPKRRQRQQNNKKKKQDSVAVDTLSARATVVCCTVCLCVTVWIWVNIRFSSLRERRQKRRHHRHRLHQARWHLQSTATIETATTIGYRQESIVNTPSNRPKGGGRLFLVETLSFTTATREEERICGAGFSQTSPELRPPTVHTHTYGRRALAL